QDRDRGRAPAARDRGLVRGRAGHRKLRGHRQRRVQLHGRPRPVPRAVHHGGHQQLGSLLRSPDRRSLCAPDPGPRPCRAEAARQRDREDRSGERVPHPGPLVGAKRGALGQGEELRGAAESLLESEATGRLARGGILLAAIGADAPSLDPHQESTFATLQMVAPLYSTLIQIDPLSYPKIIGDAASEWKIAPDGLMYTFKIRQGIKFHDGSSLTAVDVKATYEKIVSPPEGV